MFYHIEIRFSDESIYSQRKDLVKLLTYFDIYVHIWDVNAFCQLSLTDSAPENPAPIMMFLHDGWWSKIKFSSSDHYINRMYIIVKLKPKLYS